MVQYLQGVLFAFVDARRLGIVLFAPLRVRLWETMFREPDIVSMLAKHARRIGEDFWDGADLSAVTEAGESNCKTFVFDLGGNSITYERVFRGAGT